MNNLQKTRDNAPCGSPGGKHHIEPEALDRIVAVAKATVAAPSVPEEWREVMTELADDLAIEIDQSYPPERRAYPSEQRRYEREMEIVNRARALLQSSDVKDSLTTSPAELLQSEVRHD